jgi:hypothetical protein
VLEGLRPLAIAATAVAGTTLWSSYNRQYLACVQRLGALPTIPKFGMKMLESGLKLVENAMEQTGPLPDQEDVVADEASVQQTRLLEHKLDALNRAIEMALDEQTSAARNDSNDALDLSIYDERLNALTAQRERYDRMLEAVRLNSVLYTAAYDYKAEADVEVSVEAGDWCVQSLSCREQLLCLPCLRAQVAPHSGA